jgi:hypothetical protein
MDVLCKMTALYPDISQELSETIEGLIQRILLPYVPWHLCSKENSTTVFNDRTQVRINKSHFRLTSINEK